jgi:RNA polymerase sigma-70 factor (ECF subfamily)
VQQCINGDMAACRLLYERYAKAMYNTALRMLNSVSDAEDVLQESFTDAFLQLGSFQQRSTFGAWLKQIVVNKCINHLKKNKAGLVETDSLESTAAEATEMGVDENEMELNVLAVKKGMAQLADGYRTVLTLYLFEGYDHEEIAVILNLQPSSVRTQYIRAKQKLLQLIKKEKVYG